MTFVLKNVNFDFESIMISSLSWLIFYIYFKYLKARLKIFDFMSFDRRRIS